MDPVGPQEVVDVPTHFGHESRQSPTTCPEGSTGGPGVKTPVLVVVLWCRGTVTITRYDTLHYSVRHYYCTVNSGMFIQSFFFNKNVVVSP